MAIAVEEDVLGFEVSIGHTLALVQELQDQCKLRSVEARHVFLKSPIPSEICEDLPSRDVVQLRMA